MAATRSKAGDNGSRIGAAAQPSGSSPTFVLARPEVHTIEVPIVGISSLIVHAWSEKAIQMMLDAQTKGKARTKKKEPKDPEADYRSSLYVSEDGWTGVPATAFKAAMVGACRNFDGLTMTLAKRIFFVEPDGRGRTHDVDLVRIQGDHHKRRDMVRLESGTADIRFRAEYRQWSAKLRVTFNASVIQAESVLALIEAAGWSEGICEWRPSAPKSSTGMFGRWRIVAVEQPEEKG